MERGWVLVEKPPLHAKVRWERADAWVEIRSAPGEFEIVDSTGYSTQVATLEMALCMGYERQAFIDGE